jgi:hypothetical protein
MVERPDIDALLIGALYGELTPADEARLAAHFESHPGDRTALAAMTDTRQAVRESRILQVRFEPPQAVSALLLQEAARRAPKKVEQKEPSEGWFARFMRSFVAHPAMAAAAMLVIVVGVAGTMYLRKGDQFAEKTYDTRATPAAGSSAATATITPAEPTSVDEARELEKRAGSAYAVDLATGSNELAQAKADPASLPGKNNGSSYIEITPPTLEPKELPERQKVAKKPAPKVTVAGKTGATSTEDGFVEGRSAGAKPTDSAPAAESAPRAPTASAPAPAGGAAPPAKAKDKTLRLEDAKVEQKPDVKADGSQVVRDLHARLVNQVKAGNCREAASLAIQIVNRDRPYYIQNVETDRSVKPCIAYISSERERETERTQKRAAPKSRLDEPAKPSTK